MKIFKIITLLASLFLFFNFAAQTQNLQLVVRNHPRHTITLARFNGDQIIPVTEKSYSIGGLTFDMTVQKPNIYLVILKKSKSRKEQGKALNWH
jgi:hypothetical protein